MALVTTSRSHGNKSNIMHGSYVCNSSALLHTHTHTEWCTSGQRFGGLFILSRDALTVYQGHPLNNRPFDAPLFPRLPHGTPSIWPFMLTLFLTPLLSRTQSGTGREDGAGMRGRGRRRRRGVGEFASLER